MTLRSLKNIKMEIINGTNTDQELNEHFNASEIKLFGDKKLSDHGSQYNEEDGMLECAQRLSSQAAVVFGWEVE